MAKGKSTSGKIKLGTSDLVIRGIGYVLVTIYALACIIPFLIIIGTSFTSETVIRSEGVKLIPKEFTTAAYDMVMKGGMIWKSYGLTIIMTLTGTVVGLSIIAMTGYALQRKDYPFRNVISFYIYFTTLFSAGLAPYYLLMTQTYKLNDSYFAVWLPLLMSSWLIILMKNFVKSIPHEITESGKIDGAGDFHQPDSSDAEAGSRNGWSVPGAGLLERVVSVFSVLKLPCFRQAAAVHPVSGCQQRAGIEGFCCVSVCHQC